MTYKRLSVLTFLFVLTISCSSLSLDADDSSSDNTLRQSGPIDFDWTDSPGVKNVLRRASQLATIRWTPMGEVPFNGGFFSAGTTVVGIPYSSTKQINKYVGLDISLHTYMTAVHNPRSVLYTENIGNAPYNGVNCATYYGTVCSSAVDYALDLNFPYPSKMLVEQPYFQKLEITDWSSLKPGDVMYRPGHVFMIMKVDNQGTAELSTVSIFEAASRVCGISVVHADLFQKRINSEGLTAYRYSKIDCVKNYSVSPYVQVGTEKAISVAYNDSLCPNHGDESVYREGEDIVINTFNDSYSTLIVKGKEELKYAIQRDIILRKLSPGKYTAYLTDGIKNSEKVSFIVADPKVIVRNVGQLQIEFSCNQGTPSYYVLCDCSGNYLRIHPFSDDEISKGEISVEPLEVGEYYCKVVFQTPYGTVINEPIVIN